MLTHHTWRDCDDGPRQFVYHWTPSPPSVSTGTIVIVHGMGEHAGRYAEFAEHTTARGWGVSAPDLRGHGKTLGKDMRLKGHFGDHNGWGLVVGDIIRVIEQAAAAHPGKPVALIGHSMGAYFAQAVLATGVPITKAVLIASNVAPRPLVSGAGITIALAGCTFGFSRRQCVPVNLLCFLPAVICYRRDGWPAGWLTRDPAKQREFNDDPLCGFGLSCRSWADFLLGISRLRQSRSRIPRGIPVLFLGGEQDALGGSGDGPKRLAKEFNQAGILASHEVFAGMRHELLNEIERGRVFGSLLDWLSKDSAHQSLK